MAANEDPKDIAAADKAYQAAVEAVPAKSADPAEKAKQVKAGAKLKAAKPVAKNTAPMPVRAEVKPEPAKAVETVKADKPAAVPVAVKPAPEPKPLVAARPAVEVKPVAEVKPAETKPIVEAKPVEAKPTPIEKAIPVKAATPKPAVEAAGEKIKPVAPVASPMAAISKAAKTAPQYAFAELFTQFMLEDKTMDMSANFSGFQDAMTEAQAKAKEVFEKSTKMLGEVGDFTKGNVEAVIESGKILAEGVQSLGSELVAEGRSTFELMTGDIKELAAAKSPTDFFKIQSDMMRKNFDSAVAYGSKNSETMLKLASDVMAPISGRVSMAMEKARSVSI